MTNDERRIEVLSCLAEKPDHSMLQRRLVTELELPRRDVHYTVLTLAADGYIERALDDLGNLCITLIRCAPTHGIHTTPHRGCLLR